jgi:hypothetical protein
MQDAAQRGAGFHHPAACRDRGHQRLGHRIGPTLARSPCRRPGPPCLPDRETSPHPRHRGRNRDASPRRRAWRGHGDDSKVSSSQARGEAAGNGPCPMCRTRPWRDSVLSMKYASARNPIFEPSSPNRCGASSRESRRHSRFPRFRIGWADSARDPRPRLGHVGGNARPACHRGKTRQRGGSPGHEGAAVAGKFRAIGLEKRASSEKGQVHRRPVVAESPAGCIRRS